MGRYWNSMRYSSHNRPLHPRKDIAFTNVSPPKSVLIRVDIINDTASMTMPGKP